MRFFTSAITIMSAPGIQVPSTTSTSNPTALPVVEPKPDSKKPVTKAMPVPDWESIDLDGEIDEVTVQRIIVGHSNS